MYSCMTPAAFRAALAQLGLSPSQAAVLLEKNIRLIRDWASGRKLIPWSITEPLMWNLVLQPTIIPIGAKMFFSTSRFYHWCTEALWLLHNGKEVPALRPEILPADD
jgi:hypothetical protein